MPRERSTSQRPDTTIGHYAPINGLQLYYEIHGPATGTPLVLIHGGGSTIGTSFGRIIPLLSKSHRVIAVEMQAHGHTRDIDRPFTFQQDADDIAALLAYLHIPKASVLGFSNGGSTALQVGIRHPSVVDRLVIVSANFRRSGMQAGFWDFMMNETFAEMPQPYKDAYLAINPSDEGLHAMHDRDAARMKGFTDFPDEDVHGIHAPTLVMVGDRDVVTPEHALELSRLVRNGRLCILPGGHGEFFGEISFPVPDEVPRAFVSIVEEFLGGASNAGGLHG